MTSGSRFAVLLGVIAVAIVGFIIANGSGTNSSTTSTTPATTSTGTSATTSTGSGGAAAGTTTSTTTSKPAGPPVFHVFVKGAKPAGGVLKVKVKKGDQVNLIVTSDTADEIHIHGYDLHKDLPAGGTVKFGFKATIDGSFTIELEKHKEEIAHLTVEP
jgi:hypothetical protein